MLTYLLRRLLHMIPLLLGITFLAFLVIDLAPGDYFATLRMNPTISPELIRAMEREFGYGDPLLVRYSKWLWRAVHLDLGMSIAYRVRVTDLIGARAANTVILALASMMFTWILAIPLGVFAALRPHSFSDRLLSFFAFVGMSLPSFFLAFLVMVLALRTGWFPVGGTVSIAYDSMSYADQLADRLAHLVLPTIVLGTAGMASLTRLMRANVLEIKASALGRIDPLPLVKIDPSADLDCGSES